MSKVNDNFKQKADKLKDVILRNSTYLLSERYACGGDISPLKTVINVDMLDLHRSNSVIICIVIAIFGFKDTIADNDDNIIVYEKYLPIREQLDMGRTISQDVLLYHLNNPIAIDRWKSNMTDREKNTKLSNALTVIYDILKASDEIWVDSISPFASNIMTLFDSVPGIGLSINTPIKNSVWRDYNTLSKEFGFSSETSDFCEHDAVLKTKEIVTFKNNRGSR